MRPGCYPGLAMADYLAMPAVSASLLKVIVAECPRAAFWQSWMNPNPPAHDDTDASDTGSIAHGILLEGSEQGISVGDFPDWRTKDAKVWRDSIRALGNIPILAHKMPPIRAMVAEARRFLDEDVRPVEPAVLASFQTGGGESETTIVWQDGETLCRIRPDRLSADRKVVVDYKTTKTSAEPERWGRTQMVGMGYYISAAFYRRGILATFGTKCAYAWLVQEQDPPYLCSLVTTDEHAFETGAEKIALGLDTWERCAKSGRWLGYPGNLICVPIPDWERSRWEDQKAIDEYEGGKMLSAADLDAGVPG